jgi:hypothetical protein
VNIREKPSDDNRQVHNIPALQPDQQQQLQYRPFRSDQTMLLLIIFASQPIGNGVLALLNEVYYRCKRRFSSILQHSLC